LKISIIIPTFNEYENLLKSADFFGKVNTSDLEIIVSDSKNSFDNSKNIGNPYTYLPSGVSGRAAQMNKGAKIATGDIFVFLHADVVPPVTFIQDIHLSISHGFHFGFFAYRFEPTSFMLDLNASFTGKKGIFSGGGDQIQYMTKSLYDALNGYDENFCIMEDFDFFRRVRKNKIPFDIIQNMATVSSRKYANNSWLRVNFANLVVFILFLCYVKPVFIKSVYYKILKK